MFGALEGSWTGREALLFQMIDLLELCGGASIGRRSRPSQRKEEVLAQRGKSGWAAWYLWRSGGVNSPGCHQILANRFLRILRGSLLLPPLRHMKFVSFRSSVTVQRPAQEKGNSFLYPLTPFVTRRAVHVLFRSRLSFKSLMVIVHDPAAKKTSAPIHKTNRSIFCPYIPWYLHLCILHALLHRKRSDPFVLNSLEFLFTPIKGIVCRRRPCTHMIIFTYYLLQKSSNASWLYTQYPLLRTQK